MASLSVFFEILSCVLPKLKKKAFREIDERIEMAIEYINLNVEKRVTIEELAHECSEFL